MNSDILDPKTAQPNGANQGKGNQLSSSGYQNHQNRSARDHPKWPEFAKWCADQPRQLDKRGRPKPNTPTEKGFWTWRSKQKHYWRDKVRQNPAGESGYRLDSIGPFLTKYAATKLGENNPDLLVRFQPATRKANGGVVSQPPTNGSL